MRGNAVHFTQTKTDKNRSAPIDPALAEEILAFRASKSEVIGDHIFENSAGAFRMGVRDACIELPEGQLIHVLRHTFASHFMMNGGNILTLQRILGHSDLPPTNRASRSLVKFVFGEEDEHEEALYGTANHRVSEGSRGRYAGQGTVQEAWVQ
ncbi:tyrosine-type recombinase/integrase [Burkholderia pseudomallei]|nr:tyrosine-type recombinase/integrase [Burkholderia pseudomallei]MBF3720565.1 tyrosine-type recombinase/integrase [Burkholderia pseudomallei]